VLRLSVFFVVREMCVTYLWRLFLKRLNIEEPELIMMMRMPI
jgi:hypothetical protein